MMDLISQITVSGLMFWFLAAVTIVGGLGVALSQNILYSGFCLMITLIGVAGLYLFLGADFVGAVQLIVYIGGILVVILFSVLLTKRIGVDKTTSSWMNRGVSVLGCLALLGMLLFSVTKATWRVTETVSTPTTARIGDGLLREYLFPFELISVVLLMSLVGAMVLARRAAKDNSGQQQDSIERLQ